MTNLQAGGELQSIGVPVHTPAWQESGPVQGFPSSQDPLVRVGYEHTPVLGSHVPVPRQVAGAEQDPATHAPAEHVAHPEHALPVFCQAPVVSQVWGWRGLVGLHRLSTLGLQEPAQAPLLQT